MPLRVLRASITKRLRFRLALSYGVVFTLVFIIVGTSFRQILANIQDQQNRQLLETQWGALRGYLRFRRTGPFWFYDPDKPDQGSAVARLRHVFFLADANGQVLEMSPEYRLIGADSPEEIQRAFQSRKAIWRIRKDQTGIPYLIRAGVFTDRRNREYYVATGRSLLVNQAVLSRFTWKYFSLLPFIIVTAGVFGWLLARRGLRPLIEVAEASQHITSSNLSLRIPLRGADDELDQLIATFNGMLERLERSFRHMRQFTTDVSHEMRTPITAIRGQLEVALYTANTIEQYREALANALEEAERLSEFVRVMLQLSQAESGQLTLKKTQLNLAPIVADLADQFRMAAENANIRLVSEVPSECRAEVDEIQFERLVVNLLSNAVKYTPAGGEVRLKLSSADGKVQFVVEDTGCGIPADHLPYVFNRFYRVPRIDSVMEKGLGLGLSFVQWIAKAHGGEIEVQSTPGKGSRFAVTLPVGNIEPASTVEAASQQSESK